MANIAIVNYCNLNCPYCYIDNLKSCKIQTMPVEDYYSLLEWFAAAEEHHIGITGGEPTLHPKFDSILKETGRYCRNLDATAMIYTNGINLADYLGYFTSDMYISLNCISGIDQTAILNLLNNLKFFTENKVLCKCVLYPELKRYGYFWNIIDTYHLKNAEVAIAMPAGKYSKYRFDKEKYYNIMKPIFLQFCKDAIKHECILSVGCPEIPMCYFTLEEQEIINEACDLDTINKTYCEPIMEITPDWMASICFAANDEFVDIRPFASLMDLDRYLLFKNTYPRLLENCTGKCTSCPDSKLLQCQGGCLGFVDI